MEENFKFHFFELFQQSLLPYEGSIIMMQNNSNSQHSFAFTVNSGFQLLFKCNTIPCTIDHLSMILVVLKDGPIKVPEHSTPCFDICLQVHSGAPMFRHP